MVPCLWSEEMTGHHSKKATWCERGRQLCRGGRGLGRHQHHGRMAQAMGLYCPLGLEANVRFQGASDGPGDGCPRLCPHMAVPSCHPLHVMFFLSGHRSHWIGFHPHVLMTSLMTLSPAKVTSMGTGAGLQRLTLAEGAPIWPLTGHRFSSAPSPPSRPPCTPPQCSPRRLRPLLGCP